MLHLQEVCAGGRVRGVWKGGKESWEGEGKGGDVLCMCGGQHCVGGMRF